MGQGHGLRNVVLKFFGKSFYLSLSLEYVAGSS